MLGLAPGSHVFPASLSKNVDGRDEAGHDEEKSFRGDALASNPESISPDAPAARWIPGSRLQRAPE